MLYLDRIETNTYSLLLTISSSKYWTRKENILYSPEKSVNCVLCNIYFVLWHVYESRLLLSLNVLNSLQLKATYVVILIQVKSLMHETEYIIDCIHVSRVMFLCGVVCVEVAVHDKVL